jgi:ribosomal protein S21
MKISVDGNFEKALKRFGRMVRDSGIMAEVREKQAYRPPGETARLKRRAAIKRKNRELAKRAELDAASTAPVTHTERMRRIFRADLERGKHGNGSTEL